MKNYLALRDLLFFLLINYNSILTVNAKFSSNTISEECKHPNVSDCMSIDIILV